MDTSPGKETSVFCGHSARCQDRHLEVARAPRQVLPLGQAPCCYPAWCAAVFERPAANVHGPHLRARD
eukprot:8968355-Lingulodinium_polyedra.AAC.1